MSRMLLHIGYGKAGSTFLQKWFRQHPELISVPLNPDGLCRGARKTLEQPLPKYYVMSDEKLGSWLPHKMLRCEFDDTFEIKKYQRRVSEHLHGMFGDSKILIVTRGFQALLRSSYSQYVKTGGDLVYSDFVRKFLPLFEELWDFSYLIELYSRTFGSEHVLVVPYELLRDDPDRFFHAIEARLGLQRFRIPDPALNPSLESRQLDCYPMLSRFVASVADRVGEPIASQLYGQHIKGIRNGLYRPIGEIVALLFGNGPADDHPTDDLETFRSGSARLAANELYADYRHEYFLYGD
jgi:hypothetical protein